MHSIRARLHRNASVFRSSLIPSFGRKPNFVAMIASSLFSFKTFSHQNFVVTVSINTRYLKSLVGISAACIVIDSHFVGPCPFGHSHASQPRITFVEITIPKFSFYHFFSPSFLPCFLPCSHSFTISITSCLFGTTHKIQTILPQSFIAMSTCRNKTHHFLRFISLITIITFARPLSTIVRVNCVCAYGISLSWLNFRIAKFVLPWLIKTCRVVFVPALLPLQQQRSSVDKHFYP